MRDFLASADVCRAVLEHAADAIFILEGDTCLGCNAKAEELFGCSREHLIGKHVHDFSPERQPDQHDSREKAAAMVDGAMKYGPQRFEWLHTRCDGSLFDAEVTLTRVEIDGEELLISVVRDITERKRLQDAVHNIAAGISAATGQTYLNLLVQYIARALGAAYAYVGELSSDKHINTTAVVKDGVIVENVEYDLPGSPCEQVMSGDLCIYQRGVRHEFPDDPLLGELEADGYIGIPLHDSNRRPIGLLVAIKRAPIDNPAFAEYIMRVFAGRTSGELERKRSIQKLLEEKTLTDTIVNSLPGIFYMIDTRGKIVWRNKLLSELTGGAYGERGTGDPLAWIIPEDHAAYEETLKEVLNIGCSSVELRIRRADGTIRTYYCLGARIVIDEVPYAIGSGVDVTENRAMQDALRESEKNFRAIFENSPIGIFQSVPEGRFLQVNEALARMFGYESPEQFLAEVTDIPHQIFVHPEWRKEFVDRVLVSEEFLHLENDYWRKDGSVLIANLYMGAVRHNGDLAFLTGFVEDITERKQTEADKRQFYRETILSVTDGKLVICDAAEIEPYLESAAVTAKIQDANDLGPIRNEVRAFFASQGLEGEKIEAFIAGVGEAATNALKHANGGMLYIGTMDGAVCVAVSDHGTGIEHLTLPRAVLLKGFSTKHSLGIGYTVMLGVADRILLATEKDGTTVVLSKSLEEPACCFPFDNIADRWESKHPSI